GLVDGLVRIEVPAAVLAEARYPLAIDPTIGPEFGFDVAVSGPAGFSQSSPAVAFDGTNHLVVWADERPAFTVGLFAARLSVQGRLLDPVGIRLRSSISGIQIGPQLAFGAQSYLVVWEEQAGSYGAYGLRVGTDGRVRDEQPIALAGGEAGDHRSPAVAHGDEGFLVVWEDSRNGSWDIFAARVREEDGSVLDPRGIGIATGVQNQRIPAVASSGGRYLAVWEDHLPEGIDIQGALIDGGEVRLSPKISAAPRDQNAPRVSGGPDGFLAVWHDQRNGFYEVFGARLDGTGVVKDVSGVDLSVVRTHQIYPSVAYSSMAGYFVCWMDYRSNMAWDIYGTRFDFASGEVRDRNGLAISTRAGEEWLPAVSADGAGLFLVTWMDPRFGDWEIYGARIDGGSGQLIDREGIDLSPSADTQSLPAVAYFNTQIAQPFYMVVWESYRSGSWQIYGARVSAAGILLDAQGIAISTAAGEQRAPAIARISGNLAAHSAFLVVWQDDRNVAGKDIYGTYLDRQGRPQQPQGMAISQAAGDQLQPAAACSSQGSCLVVWVDQRNGNRDVYGARLSSDQPVAQEIAISRKDVEEAEPTVAIGSSSYLVAWQDWRDAALGPDILAARVEERTGVLLDQEGFALVKEPGAQVSPTLVFGQGYLAVWRDLQVDSGDVFGVRVHATEARLLDAAPLSIAKLPGAQFWSTASYGGTNYLVAWEDHRTALPSIQAARVRASDGRVLGNMQFPLTGGQPPIGERYPVLAADGATRHLLTYHRFQEAAPYGSLRLASRLITELTNERPVADPQSLETDEDTNLAVKLTGSDLDGDPLTFRITVQPGHGTLSGVAPEVTYRPAANYNGEDSFSFVVNDGKIDSIAARISLRVRPVNDAPKANPLTVQTGEDTPLPIVLTGSDVENDPLTFAVLTQPQHGTLSGNPPALTYTPAANWFGTDSFTFQVSDGQLASAPATVTITVASINDPPVANPQTVQTNEDSAVDIRLTGSDVEDAQLTYSIVVYPSRGTLTGSAPNVRYTPSTNYNGKDSFDFQVRDSGGLTGRATVSIDVLPVNDPPVASSQQVSTNEDTPVVIVLTGSDLDGDALTFAVREKPANGTLAGDPPELTYRPKANWYGTDRFTFVANDGKVDSALATVTITVRSVNDPPVADPQAVSAPEDTPTTVVLTGSDVEGSALSFYIVTGPIHGTISGGTGATRTYRPSSNYNGPDSFTFRVYDGSLYSEIATVSVTVTPVNDPPVAQSQSVVTPEDTPREIVLGGSDVEGSPLTFAVVRQPQHGALTGTPPALVFTPVANWYGTDTFTFVVNDGELDSAQATVTITVTSVNDPPVADPQTVTTPESTPVSIVLTGSDPEGSYLRYSLLSQPQHGSL
ncbi:MAG: tandem-95 repeat protein, partial [Deltaproteobacteria bacterium]|nr:tandem-95 repeat protein [Deltaproteobacteria bacterium]